MSNATSGFELFGIDPLDTSFLLSFLVTVVFQLSCFVVAYLCSFDKITDLAGCSNFIIIAVGTILLAPQPLTIRQIVLTALVCASRFQLAGYLLYRVLKRGKDARFDEVRENCAVFLFFWIWQILWVYIVSVGIIFVNAAGSDVSDTLTAYDYAGWAVFVLGFVLQVWSDMVKQDFRGNPENKKKVCDVGPWKWSRHPNFCGEVVMWWGVFIGGVPVFLAHPSGWSTVAAPLFTMFVLLCFTGIPQAEGKASKRWYDGGAMQAQFEAYFESTPPLWLCPPSIYRSMPLCLKRTLCFELPCYQFTPEMNMLSPGTTETPYTEAVVPTP